MSFLNTGSQNIVMKYFTNATSYSSFLRMITLLKYEKDTSSIV